MTQTPDTAKDVTAAGHADEATDAPAAPVANRSRLLVGLAVLVLFAIIIGVRIFGDGTVSGPAAGGDQASTIPDPVVALDAALGEGEPIYVLFHSSSCAPCAEMEELVARVLPDYEGILTYVDAPTDDPRTGPLYERFSFQYIPTSFFITAEGELLDSYTGVLTDDEMRLRLDALLAAAE